MISQLKISEETLDEYSFGDYMNEVDEWLEELIGRTSGQEELQFIAELQECSCLPQETAWAIAKENFSKPWKSE